MVGAVKEAARHSAAAVAIGTLLALVAPAVSVAQGRSPSQTGDLDGDGDGEVLVGAPGLTVRGSAGAGAVLAFDVEGEHPEQPSGRRVLPLRPPPGRRGRRALSVSGEA
jgi:hypothetical protein